MRCGAACGQSLQMQRSMRTKFADAAQHADAFFVIRAISNRDFDLHRVLKLCGVIRTLISDNYFFFYAEPIKVPELSTPIQSEKVTSKIPIFSCLQKINLH